MTFFVLAIEPPVINIFRAFFLSCSSLSPKQYYAWTLSMNSSQIPTWRNIICSIHGTQLSHRSIDRHQHSYVILKSEPWLVFTLLLFSPYLLFDMIAWRLFMVWHWSFHWLCSKIIIVVSHCTVGFFLFRVHIVPILFVIDTVFHASRQVGDILVFFCHGRTFPTFTCIHAVVLRGSLSCHRRLWFI